MILGLFMAANSFVACDADSVSASDTAYEQYASDDDAEVNDDPDGGGN